MKLKKVVTIFGAGSWGTAIAKNISRNGYKVHLWAKEKEVVESITKFRENRVYLPGIKLPSMIIPTLSLDKALFKSDFLIFSIPTQFIRESLSVMKNMINKDSILINTSKGIEQSSMKPIFSIFKDVLPRVSKRYVTISGPSFAYDVANGLPTSVTLATSNPLLLPVAMKIFEIYNTDENIGPAPASACSRPAKDLPASWISSCKSQGKRKRTGNRSEKVGGKTMKVSGKRIKGKKYGGPLPDYSK